LLYNKFSEYLKNRYGEKVYKLPVNIPATCPNRDGKLGTGGCIFCGEEGAGFENLPSHMSVAEQLEKNAAYIGRRYGAKKYIAYFQNYSNTYLPFEKFRKYVDESCAENVVAIYISTRSDCINTRYLEYLAEIKKQKGIDIVIELGLQTVNYHTLKILKRGHTLAEFIDSVISCREYGLDTCAHYIVDLPMDTIDDIVEGARIISALRVNQVKCHSLYILKGTELGDMYEKGMIKPVSMKEYMDRIITFLEYLDPKIVVQRLIGRAPEERTLFSGWNTSWWKVVEAVEGKMEKEGRYQGRLFDYLNGGRVMASLTDDMVSPQGFLPKNK